MWRSTIPMLVAVGSVIAPAASADDSGAKARFAQPVETVNADGLRVVRGSSYTATVKGRTLDVDLRRLPVRATWRPGDPVRTVPRRRGTPAIADPRPVNPVKPGDPLLDRQTRAMAARAATGFSTPKVNIDGQRSGSNPHDANGEVGQDFFVQAINGAGGTRYTFYNKADGSIAAGPFTLSDLADGSGPCSGGLGDPVALYDELARRWILTEFSSTGNRMCVYVAQTGDPITGGWYAYDFEAPDFPDYPKYAVWNDAYFVGTNEASSTLYALERSRMLQGLPAAQQRFSVADPAAFGFAMVPPVDHDGIDPPPAGAPGLFIRHFDDEAHDPGNNDPNGDRLQLWELDIDWQTPANSALTGPIEVPIAEIDSELCGFTSFECFPQPGTGTLLDPLREVVMNLPKYRNFGAFETIVGNLVTDISGNDQGGVRWFELRRVSGGNWTLNQEGTFAPDLADPAGALESRWMAGSAIDESGNIALAHSISNALNLFPSLGYAGRQASDPAGVLTTPETVIVTGSAAHTSSTRWGDYASMSVDPADGCTFWFTSNYGSSASAPTASTRIASFRFDDCGVPTFVLGGTPLTHAVCTASGSVELDPIELEIGSRNGFVEQVDLALLPPPPGFSGSISPSSVLPPGSAVASITAGAGTVGEFVLTIEGTAAGVDPRTLDIDVDALDQVPAGSALSSPADGAVNVALRPVFAWDAAALAREYRLQVGTDPDFAAPVIDVIVAGTAFQPEFELGSDTRYYWRVIPQNQCGPAAGVASASFTTRLGPGECAADAQRLVHFADDIEGGDNGWSHAAAVGPDTWLRQTIDASSPVTAWQADDLAEVSDQRLVSPTITLPFGAKTPTLQYFARRGLEAGGPGCFDAGLLEYSSDGGQNWIQVDSARLLTNPYTGDVSTDFENPLGGSRAWCGTRDWTLTVVDLGGLQGLDLQFRYRLGSDSSIGDEGWWIDDVTVQSCQTEQIFADGFESP